jgi:hypothetical protein
MTLHIGFTGTQAGMNPYQLGRVLHHLRPFRGGHVHFHHGDCIGADAQAVEIAVSLGFYIVCHPPINKYKRAFCGFDEIHPEKDYIPRNHDIVDSSAFMLATPKTAVEELRSGTWATIRYAKKVRCRIWVIGNESEVYFR